MIEINNLTYTYPRGENRNGIYDISLIVRTGEVVLFCGESGCGKTTLTRVINGLIPHFFEGELKGTVRLNGKLINSSPIYETAKSVGSVFQNPRSQFFNIDTDSELAFGCENRGLPEEEIRERVCRTIDDFNINSLLNRNLFSLSGGEKQKIACASVSALEPEIMVLDEPSSNLDAAGVEDLRKMIELWKSRGRTIIIAEHRLYYLRDLFDRIIYLKKGRIENEYSPDQFINLPSETRESMGLRTLNQEELFFNGRALGLKQKTMNLNNFCFAYKQGIMALDLEDFCLPSGVATAVIGANGAGKSSFARCLCGLNKKFRGYLEKDTGVYRGKSLLQLCYMVMQDVNHQLFTESVLDEVLLSMEENDEKEALAILKTLDLDSTSGAHPHSLSGGQKQRVAIASAVASGKELIIFDEPTSGLDLKHMKEVSRIIQKLTESGKNVFIVSHDLEFIRESCHHIIHLEKGRLIGNYPLDKAGMDRIKEYFIPEKKRVSLCS